MTRRGLIVDLFAGGGGASTGLLRATGRHPDIAINHSRAAVAVHTANHPPTLHFCEDVFEVSPREVCGGRAVEILWASPDCTHHSRARGGKPRDRKRRALASVVLRWAAMVRPRIILLENVLEFLDWGPLCEEGKPIKELAGRDFDAWVTDLRLQGYRVDWRELNAADYGAPTNRTRLFLVARRDGAPIVWPEPTHGPGRLAYRTAAEIIDWFRPAPSIFDRKKPLKDNTHRRIAHGLKRYVLDSADPFFVDQEDRLGAAYLIQTGYGERHGQTPRTFDVRRPAGTAVAGGVKQALVVAWMTKHYGGVVGHDLRRPLGAITTVDHHSFTTATLSPTGVDRAGVERVRAFMVKYYGTGGAVDLRRPLDTITTHDRFGLVTVGGVDYQVNDIGMRMLSPRELFRAQGFPEDYVIDIVFGRRPLSGRAQVELVGNSVCPDVAAALAKANLAARVPARPSRPRPVFELASGAPTFEPLQVGA